MAIGFTINGKAASVDTDANTPLLWVIREHLKLTGTKFGCGSGLCGACIVHVDGKAVPSCQATMSEVAGKKARSRWPAAAASGLTVAALVGPGDDADVEVLARLQARLATLDAAAELPLWDPDPVGTFAVESAMPPEHYEGAVARGVERIRAGALDKIVLAREVQVHAPAHHDPAAILGILREGFPSCFVFCVGCAATAPSSPRAPSC